MGLLDGKTAIVTGAARGIGKAIIRSYEALDSFVIYMILEGNLTLKWNGGSETAVKGETILIPACIEQVTLEGEGKLLEIYID